MGDTVISTLSANLQTTAYNALGDRRGAVVAMEPSTGKILAMVSKPTFDPNTISEDWEWLTTDRKQFASESCDTGSVCAGDLPLS